MDQLVHQLLYAAMIEARSCERFRLLSESIDDKALQKFYKKLMISEAHHYTLFLKLARKYGKYKKTVNEKWDALLEFESQLIAQLGKKKPCTVRFFCVYFCACILSYHPKVQTWAHRFLAPHSTLKL